jgi:hypothetical protein
MRLGRWTSLGLLVAAVWGLGAGGCKYDPHPINGALGCGPSDECPEGFTCQANRCWSEGGPSNKIDDYLGDWRLGVTSNVVTTCDNGSSPDTTLLSPANSPSTMTLARATGTDDLTSSWVLCDLVLHWDSTGAHLKDGNPACVDDTGDPVYTWTATKFDVVAVSGGATAMHTAIYKRKDEYVDGTVANCNQTVTAPLTKE